MTGCRTKTDHLWIFILCPRNLIKEYISDKPPQYDVAARLRPHSDEGRAWLSPAQGCPSPLYSNPFTLLTDMRWNSFRGGSTRRKASTYTEITFTTPCRDCIQTHDITVGSMVRVCQDKSQSEEEPTWSTGRNVSLESVWAGIAQSVQQLATGWTVRGQNHGGGDVFLAHPDRPWGPPTLLHEG